jgi:hypothetical protein
VVEGARLESDSEIAKSVTKSHNSCGRTHYLSHIPSNKVTLCHTESTQQSTQVQSLVRGLAGGSGRSFNHAAPSAFLMRTGCFSVSLLVAFRQRMPERRHDVLVRIDPCAMTKPLIVFRRR